MCHLHPAPAEGVTDHRETHNRRQLTERSESQAIYKRVVEDLAKDLQIEPYEAHLLIRDGAYEVTKGLAWHWWF